MKFYNTLRKGIEKTRTKISELENKIIVAKDKLEFLEIIEKNYICDRGFPKVPKRWLKKLAAFEFLTRQEKMSRLIQKDNSET